MASRLSIREATRSPTVLTAAVLSAIVVAFLYWARAVVIPLALAIFVTFILSPAVSALCRRGVGRITSVALVSTAALVVILGVGVFLTWQIASLVQELPDHAETIRAKLDHVTVWLGATSDSRLAALIEEIRQAFVSKSPKGGLAIPVIVTSEKPGWSASMGVVAGLVVESLASVALTALLTAFMLLTKEDMRNRVLRLIGPRRLTATTKAVDDAGVRISRYLRMQLLINASFGVCVAIALLVLQVPYAVLWGFIAGVMRYVPYIGAWIGLFPPVIAALAMSHSLWQPVFVVGIYAALEILVNSVAEPRLFGHSLGLSEVALILSAAFWAFLWGPIGLILSGPLTACLLVLGKNVPQLHFLEVLLGDEEALSPSMAFFQRLAARDRDEAWHVARQYAAAHSPEQLADGLLLPAVAQIQVALDRRELSDDEAAWAMETVREIADDLDDLAEPPPADTDSPPHGSTPLKVIAIPGGERCDELALDLLLPRLDPRTWDVVLLSAKTLVSEMAEAVKEQKPAAVLIATLAAGSMDHTRYVCKRLRSAAPELKILVGRLGDCGAGDDWRAELAQVGVAEVCTALAGIPKWLATLRPVLEATQTTEKSKPVPPREKAAIGTASALVEV